MVRLNSMTPEGQVTSHELAPSEHLFLRRGDSVNFECPVSELKGLQQTDLGLKVELATTDVTLDNYFLLNNHGELPELRFQDTPLDTAVRDELLSEHVESLRAQRIDFDSSELAWHGEPVSHAAEGSVYGYFFELAGSASVDAAVVATANQADLPDWLSLAELSAGRYFLSGTPTAKDTSELRLQIEARMQNAIEPVAARSFELRVKGKAAPGLRSMSGGGPKSELGRGRRGASRPDTNYLITSEAATLENSLAILTGVVALATLPREALAEILNPYVGAPDERRELSSFDERVVSQEALIAEIEKVATAAEESRARQDTDASAAPLQHGQLSDPDLAAEQQPLEDTRVDLEEGSDITPDLVEGDDTNPVVILPPTFTNGDDVINFNFVVAGTFNPETYYNALGGNDIVTLPDGTPADYDITRPFFAGAGDDTIFGGALADTIFGDSGNDTLFGGGNNDVLDGGAGNDTLDGGPGNDTLLASAGTDTYIGGAGTDTLTYVNNTAGIVLNLATNTVTSSVGNSTYSGIETVIASSGADTIIGTVGNDVISAGAGDDTIIGNGGADVIDGGAGTNTISFAGNANGVTIDYAAGTVTDNATLDVTTFNNTAIVIGSDVVDTINGTTGNDTFIASTGADTYNGLAGTDTVDYSNDLKGSILNVDLGGGVGGNVITSIGGTDIVNDIENIIGTSGNDEIFGSIFNNVLTGGAGNDRINGREGDDILFGGDGNDELDIFPFTDRGNDQLFGGAGDDIIGVGTGSNTADGGSGTDTISWFSLDGPALTVDMITGIANKIDSANDPQVDTFSNFENIIGSGTADFLYGDNNNNIIDGGGNNDFIDGRGGIDTLLGGVRDDTLVFDHINGLLETVDGGSEVVTGDTLLFNVDGTTADFSGILTYTDLEFFDLSALGTNITLDPTAVINMSTTDSLRITGGADDTLNIAGWAFISNAGGFDTYQLAGAEVVVSDTVNVVT